MNQFQGKQKMPMYNASLLYLSNVNELLFKDLLPAFDITKMSMALQQNIAWLS